MSVPGKGIADMPLKVIGAGMPRTGTSSLKAALERLGFGPCYHMIEAFPRPDHWPFWARAYAGEPVDREEIFGEFPSTTDAPACRFYAELALRYHEAKVILTLREPEAWFASTQGTVLSDANPRMQVAKPLLDAIGWNPTDPALHDHDQMIGRFQAHNAHVQRTIPSERLLVFRAGDGWGPLCDFLGVEAPDEPYPTLNSTDDWNKRRAGAPLPWMEDLVNRLPGQDGES